MILLHVFFICEWVSVCVFLGTRISTGHIENQLIQQFLDCQIILDVFVYSVCECVCVRFFRAISCYLFLVINDVGCHGRFLFALLCSAAILAPFLSLSFSYFLLCRTLSCCRFLSLSLFLSFTKFQNVKRRWIRQNQRKKSLPKDCFYHSFQTFSHIHAYNISIQCCRWKLWNVSSTHIFCAHTVLTAAYDRLYVVCMSLPPLLLLLSLLQTSVSGRRENRSFITTKAAANWEKQLWQFIFLLELLLCLRVCLFLIRCVIAWFVLLHLCFFLHTISTPKNYMVMSLPVLAAKPYAVLVRLYGWIYVNKYTDIHATILYAMCKLNAVIVFCLLSCSNRGIAAAVTHFFCCYWLLCVTLAIQITKSNGRKTIPICHSA